MRKTNKYCKAGVKPRCNELLSDTKHTHVVGINIDYGTDRHHKKNPCCGEQHGLSVKK